jgi:hypothetical protein
VFLAYDYGLGVRLAAGPTQTASVQFISSANEREKKPITVDASRIGFRGSVGVPLTTDLEPDPLW